MREGEGCFSGSRLWGGALRVRLVQAMGCPLDAASADALLFGTKGATGYGSGNATADLAALGSRGATGGA